MNSSLNVSVSDPPPPASNQREYRMSDLDDFSGDDMSGDDSDDPGEKFIPQWARKGNFLKLAKLQERTDPDTIFGRMNVRTCDLNALFKNFEQKTRYQKRGASGDWTQDRLAWCEERKFKRDMGFMT